MELRYHSPYRRWVLGLLTELATFVAFVAAAALIALLASWAT